MAQQETATTTSNSHNRQERPRPVAIADASGVRVIRDRRPKPQSLEAITGSARSHGFGGRYGVCF